MQDIPWTVDKFRLPYHKFLFQVLDGICPELWNTGIFAGGTLCAFRLEEYRQSDDLDIIFESTKGLSHIRSLGPSIFTFGKCCKYTYYEKIGKLACEIQSPFENRSFVKCELFCHEDFLEYPQLLRTQVKNDKFKVLTYDTAILMKMMAFCNRAPLSETSCEPSKDIVDLAVLFGKIGQERFITAFENLKEIWNGSWTRNRLRNKLNESILLNSMDHHWLLPAERRLAERAGVEFLKFAAEYFDIPYTLLERTARGIEDRECEAYLDYLDGKIVHGDAALARGWLPFVAFDPVAEEVSPYTIQDVREYSEDDMDEPCTER